MYVIHSASMSVWNTFNNTQSFSFLFLNYSMLSSMQFSMIMHSHCWCLRVWHLHEC